MSGYNDRVIEEFRANGGRVDSTGHGGDLVLLHSVGARSGEPRVTPLLFRRDGDDWLVIGSKGGAPTHPAWYFNVRAHADVEIETADGRGGVERIAVHAEEVPDAEYPAAWARFVERSHAFERYADRTGGRRMPIIRLRRR